MASCSKYEGYSIGMFVLVGLTIGFIVRGLAVRFVESVFSKPAEAWATAKVNPRSQLYSPELQMQVVSVLSVSKACRAKA